MLELRHLTIHAGAATLVDDLSFALAPDGVTCLIGPSGCGKSSVVKWLSGVLSPELSVRGEAHLAGQPLAPPDRAIAYQPQEDSLFPWLTILENAALGLEVRGEPRALARRRAAEHFPAFGLAGHEDAFPHQLSGGMRQRAAFLRTIVQDTPVILLDEPFSALDAVTRLTLQDWLIARLDDRGDGRSRTVLMVTHDLFEATRIADRILVLSSRPGRLVADIPLTTPRADRTEAALAETRATLKSLLLEATE